MSNAVTSDATRWKAIEALAAPMHPGPPSATLERAVTKLDVSALVLWMQESGALRVPFGHFNGVAAGDVGRLALDEAVSWESVVAAGRLGLYLVQDGDSLFDAEIGIELLELTSKRLRLLGEPANGFERPLATDLVRVVAADAMSAYELIQVLDSPDGRQALAGDDEHLVMMEALRAFWLAALDGAKAGEPPAITLERMRRAAAAARTSRDRLEVTLQMAASTARKLEALERLAP